MFLFDLLADFLVDFLWSCLWQSRNYTEPSPWERRQARAGRWVVGVILFLLALAAVYAWASHRL